MSKRFDVIQSKPITAYEDLVAGRFVNFDGDYANDGEAMVGVNMFSVNQGEQADIANFGRMFVELESTINRGQAVTCGTDGKGKVASSGDNIGGYAVESGNSGDFIVIQLNLNFASIVDTFKIEKVENVGNSSGKIYDIPSGAVIQKVLFEITEQYASSGTITVDIGSDADPDGYLVDIDGTDPATKPVFGLVYEDRGDLLVSLVEGTKVLPIEEYHQTTGEIHLNVDAGCNAGNGNLYVFYYTLP